MQQSGYLVISDITGYTAYLTGTEQLHAEEILQDLFKVLLEHTAPPLVVNKLEGDAVLSYAPAAGFSEGQSLLESIENTYVNFRLLRENIQRHTSCDCRACSNINGLDLKFFVHHGDFSLLDIGGREELSGPNVILIHRLLKNDVPIEAYALYTADAANALDLPDYFEGHMTPHTERYDHLGQVDCYLQDMNDVWNSHQGQRRFYVSEADPQAFPPIEVDIAAPPSSVWEYVSQPKTFPEWYSGVEQAVVTGEIDGRTQAGTVGHCTHGDQTFTVEIIDMRPLDYVTYRATTPVPMLGSMRMHFTYQLTQTAAGTNMVVTTSDVEFLGSAVQRSLANAVFMVAGGRMKTRMQSDFTKSIHTLQTLIEGQIADGSRTAGVAALTPDEVDATLEKLLREADPAPAGGD